MMIRRIALAAIFVAGLAGVPGADQKLQLKDAPAAVQKGVADNLKGATLRGLSKEIEGGKTTYEAETMLDGRSRDFVLDAAGRLLEIEEELAADAVPAAVKTALEARGRIVKVESVTRGTRVTYEGTVEKDGRKSAVALDGNGKAIKR